MATAVCVGEHDHQDGKPNHGQRRGAPAANDLTTPRVCGIPRAIGTCSAGASSGAVPRVTWG